MSLEKLQSPEVTQILVQNDFSAETKSLKQNLTYPDQHRGHIRLLKPSRSFCTCGPPLTPAPELPSSPTQPSSSSAIKSSETLQTRKKRRAQRRDLQAVAEWEEVDSRGSGSLIGGGSVGIGGGGRGNVGIGCGGGLSGAWWKRGHPNRSFGDPAEGDKADTVRAESGRKKRRFSPQRSAGSIHTLTVALSSTIVKFIAHFGLVYFLGSFFFKMAHVFLPIINKLNSI